MDSGEEEKKSIEGSSRRAKSNFVLVIVCNESFIVCIICITNLIKEVVPIIMLSESCLSPHS